MTPDFNFVTFDIEIHYELVTSWWVAHKFGVIPESFLPKNGIVVTLGGQPICAGFVYLTDSSLSWIEFIVTNPEAPIRARVSGLDFLIQELTTLSKKMGSIGTFTSSNNRRLIEKFERSGFQVGDVNTTQLLHMGGA